ncbi:MAG: HEAT repeat domain-containing protein [Chloroflexota bacterium]
MKEQLSESEIEELLTELRADSPILRELAASRVAEGKISDSRVVRVLNGLAFRDPSASVRQAAAIALVQLGLKPPLEEFSGLKTEKEKPSVWAVIKSWPFLAGFFGWYVVNIAFWYVVSGGSPDDIVIIFNIILFPLNLLALIYLSVKKQTREIGLGILAALAVNLLLSAVVGSLSNGYCFLPFYMFR